MAQSITNGFNPCDDTPRSQRLFVALMPDPDFQAACRAAAEQLVARGQGLEKVRLTAGANLHVTLKFLGNVASNRIDAVVTGLTQATESVSPFTLSLREPMVFPTLRRPNVLALAVDHPPSLERLAGQLEDAYAGLGFEREGRAFRPHITVGRFKRPRRGRQGGGSGDGPRVSLPAVQLPDKLWQVDRVVLMRSQLMREGPRYDVVTHVALQGGTAD